MSATRNRLGQLPKVATMTTGTAICLLILCCLQQSAGAQDLQGVVPDYVPNGLGEEDFNQLGGNWAEWSDETGRLVTDFYTSPDDEVRGRRQTLDRIQVKVNTMERALSDPAYLPIHGPLADLHGRLARRIAVAGALLETVEQDVTQPAPARVSSSLSRLAAETRALRSYLQSINGGDRWISYLALDQIATIAGRNTASPESAAILHDVYQKLQDGERLNEQQQQFLQRVPLVRFANALGSASQLLNVENPQERQQQLRDHAATLAEALENYLGDPTSENAQLIRSSFDDLRRTSPDGAGALTAAMQKHVLNYNFRVVVDESLLASLVNQSQSDSGYINEMASRAHIRGCQWTNAFVNLDLKPGRDRVHFDLVLNGNVRSNVSGSTHMATVHTTGQFHFHGRKPVTFDGDRFTTAPAQVSVNGSQRPYAAWTRLNWIPIVRRIAQNAALREAGSAENNQYARNKVYQEARSQFDRETADMLRRSERDLQTDLVAPLREGGYYPDVKHLSSTEQQAMLRSRLMEAGEVGGSDVLPLPIYPARGALIQLHESLLSQIGDRLDLEGKRFTPEALEAYLKSEVEKITGQPADLAGLSFADQEGSDSPRVEEIIFHESDAIRFRVTGDEVVLYLSMGLKLEDREEIEPQRITVPLQFSLEGDKIHMERGTVGVSPIGAVAPADRTQQIARAGVMRQKIQEAFEPQDFDRTFDLKFDDRTLTLQVTDLRARGGWISLIATNGVVERGPTRPAAPMQQVRVQNRAPGR
jgi:hypothetical protein